MPDAGPDEIGGTVESLPVVCLPVCDATLECSRDFISSTFVSCNCFIEMAGIKLAPVFDRRCVGKMLDLEIVVNLLIVF